MIFDSYFPSITSCGLFSNIPSPGLIHQLRCENISAALKQLFCHKKNQKQQPYIVTDDSPLIDFQNKLFGYFTMISVFYSEKQS